MTTPRLSLKQHRPDASKGLKLGVILAALALVVAVLVLGREGAAPLGEPQDPALTAAELDAYLGIALEVRRGRKQAREAGVAPLDWPEHPAVKGPLDRAGWTMEDFVRVEGQVNAARLALLDPKLAERDPDDPYSRPVPEEHLELVRPRLEEVRAAQAPLPEPDD